MRLAAIALLLVAGCAGGGLPPPGGVFADEPGTWSAPDRPAAAAAAAGARAGAQGEERAISPADREALAACASGAVGQAATRIEGLLARCVGRTAIESPLRTRPLLGDLVRFAGGVLGVVVAVEASRVKFVFVRRGALVEGVVTPRAPRDRRSADGRIANTFLRPIRPGEPRRARRLAGELLEGFSSPPPPSILARGDPFAAR